MKSCLNRRAWSVLGMSAALVGGLLTAGVTAASAAPHPDRDRDRDRDGIRNRWDRDRDGDGIRNRWDRHPNRYDRYESGRYRRDWDHDRDWDRDRDWNRNREWQRERDLQREREINRNNTWGRYGNFNNGVQTQQMSRIVRYGNGTYRETYLVQYYPNGRTSTSLISRQRIY